MGGPGHREGRDAGKRNDKPRFLSGSASSRAEAGDHARVCGISGSQTWSNGRSVTCCKPERGGAAYAVARPDLPFPGLWRKDQRGQSGS